MSFQRPHHTSIYFHEYHQLPAACTTLTLTLTLIWNNLRGSWPTSNFHGSRLEVHGSGLLLPWKLELLAQKRANFQLPWKLVEASMENRCKQMEAFTEVDEAAERIYFHGYFHGSKREKVKFHKRWWKLPWKLIYLIYFHGSRWKFPWKQMETSTEVDSKNQIVLQTGVGAQQQHVLGNHCVSG